MDSKRIEGMEAIVRFDGTGLGCPDCIAGEPHCCPFVWADQQPEPKRSWALGHLRAVLADEIAVATGGDVSCVT